MDLTGKLDLKNQWVSPRESSLNDRDRFEFVTRLLYVIRTSMRARAKRNLARGNELRVFFVRVPTIIATPRLIDKEERMKSANIRL